MSRGARILFVEDEAAIADPFGRALARQGFEVIAARSVSEARARFARQPPDLVLLDLTLPDGDGRDLCRELRSASQVPIIMLTARGTELDRVTGLEIGADDYVVKPFSGAEVISRIRAVLRRSRSGGARFEQAFTVGALELDVAARTARTDGRELDLTRKEFDLLALLAQRPGVVFRREQIISEVWRTSWEGTGRTLEVHVASLRSKLRMPALIETVRGVGYRLVAPAA